MGLLFSALGSVRAEQVCDTQAYPLSSPTAGFNDNGDGTVSDKASRLMWLRCSAGQRWSGARCTGVAARLDWRAAQAEVQAVNDRGEFFFNDWRLPQVHELAMITERQCQNPRINLAVFPDTPAAFYWTATPRRGQNADDATFVLSFGSEGIRHDSRAEQFHVRMVRRAQ